MLCFLINNIGVDTLAHLIDVMNTIIDYIEVAYPDDKYIHNMFLNALDYLVAFQTKGKK